MITFEVVKAKVSTISLTEVVLADAFANALAITTADDRVTARKVIVYVCPVGWKVHSAFGDPAPRVFIHALEVAIDRNDRSGIYTPTTIEIYADPDDARTDLAGWKLTLTIPYNAPWREYALTTENSVFNEEGFLRIESPEADPFPMTNLTYSGQILPGFDYRLLDEKSRYCDIVLHRGQ